MSDADLRSQFEELVRSQAQFIYDATVVAITADHVIILPAGSKTVKRNVQLAEHINRELLFIGMKVKAHDLRGKPYIVAIFDMGQDQLKLAGIPTTTDEDGTGGLPGQDILLFPIPDPTLTCDGWTVAWQEVVGATDYELSWAEDVEGLNAEVVGETEETSYPVALDETVPPKTFFSLKSLNGDSESASSPWLTDESSAIFMPPGGFTACPFPGGYQLDVDAALDTTQSAPDFESWEVEWADDAEGLNGAIAVPVLLPADLPYFVENQATGGWTFDADTDESWGKPLAAGPDDWDADGNTTAGSRILYDGSAEGSGDIPGPNQWVGGSITQPMPEFTGLATDSITFYVKLTRSSGAGAFPARARMGAGAYYQDETGEYQQEEYARPPFEYVNFSATGAWQALTLPLPSQAVGKPIGPISIKVDVQGVPLDSILVDDIVWGPGGIKPATEKWFRMRAKSCAGIYGPFTEWVSGYADSIIWRDPLLHGTVHRTDTRYRFQVGASVLERSDDAGVTYTDVLPDLPVLPGLAGLVTDALDTPATVGDLTFCQVLQDPVLPETFYFLARFFNGFGDGHWYAWLLKTTDMGLVEWEWAQLRGGITTMGASLSWPFTSDLEGWTEDKEFYAQLVGMVAPGPGVFVQWTSFAGGGLNLAHVNGSAAAISPAFEVIIRADSVLHTELFTSVAQPMAIIGLFSDETYGDFGSGNINAGFYFDNLSLAPWVGKTMVRIYVAGQWLFGGYNQTWTIITLSPVDMPGFAGCYPLWLDVDAAGEKIALTLNKNEVLGVDFYLTETLARDSREVLLGSHTMQSILDGVYWAGPLWLPENDEILVYGRMKDVDTPPDIVQVQAADSDGNLARIITETEWAVGDFAGGAVIVDQMLVLIRHASFLAQVLTVVADLVTYELPDALGQLETTLLVSQQLLNLTQEAGETITGLDLAADEITVEDDPVGWGAADILAVATRAELWSGPIDITVVSAFTALIEDIPLTINPGGIALSLARFIVLGNRLEDDEMVNLTEPPYAMVSDVTDDYPAGVGVVALRYAESGCLAEGPPPAGGVPIVDAEGNPIGVVTPPIGGDSGGGTPVVITPPGQPPQARALRHDELTELSDNDHPQYALLANAVMDGDMAGGVLSGTYPNPGFAADMATQVELDAHLADATDAHDASAISSVPTGTLAATNVQAALDELDGEKAALASAVMDGDGAGGVLSGSYPNPGFAVDMAEQDELDGHIASFHENAVLIRRFTLLYDTATPLAMFTPPASSTILRAVIKVSTVFDATGSLALEVGVAGTPARYIAADDVHLDVLGTYEVEILYDEDGSPEAMIGTFDDGTGGSTGAAQVYIYYTKFS